MKDLSFFPQKKKRKKVVTKKVVPKLRKKRVPIKKSYSSFSAETILRQLGGRRFIAMTGSKDFVTDNKKRRLMFKIGRNSKNINFVEIKLNVMDTYDMNFYKLRMGKLTLKSKSNGVYNDQLQSVFTKHTGLYTRL